MRALALFVLIAALTVACFAIGAAGASAVSLCSTGPFTSNVPGEYCYSLPAGTTALRVVATGGGGGAGGARTNQNTAARLGNGGAGGAGAKVIAYLTNLSPSSSLWVEVGGLGTAGSDQLRYIQQPGDTPGGPGGANGGAAGGTSQKQTFAGPQQLGSSGGGGGGGGGASDIRTVSCTPSCPGDGTSQASRLLVAGGGGGGGGLGPNAAAPGAGDDGGSGNFHTGDANGGGGGSTPYGGGGGGGGGGYRGGTGGAGGTSASGSGGHSGSNFISSATGATFGTASAATNGSVEITPVAQTALSTTATTPVTMGSQMSDSAVLSGGSSPTGTITFNVYGPNDAPCQNTPVATSSATVTGNGTYSSGSFAPTQTGTYRFIATYSGDDANTASGGACGDAGESVVVTKVQPALATTASAPVTVGGGISDSATLSGGSSPTGTINFKAYGPDDSTCTGTPVLSVDKTVTGNGTYDSGSFPPAAAGTYRFVASYSGDAKNAPVTGSCIDPSESVVVSQAEPVLSTSASPATAVGGTISDSATLSNGHAPTGTITFDLYAPGDPTCATAPTATSTSTVSGNDSYDSDSFTAEAVGTYHFIASYSGDANNAAATGACTDSGESVEVSAHDTQTSISCPAGVVGDAESCQVTVTDVNGGTTTNPSGTVSLSSPDGTGDFGSATCTLQPVSGSGDTSTCSSDPSFTPSSAGTAQVQAGYAGDSTHSTSSSGPVDVDVAKHATQTSISCPGGAVSDAESCTVTVHDVNGGTTTNPTGSVALSAPDSNGDFSSPSCDLEAVSGSSDTSTCQPDASYTPSAVGANTVTADYTGDSTHATSGSGEVDVSVDAHATETSISCPGGTVGDAESCTVTVKDTNPGSTTSPTGSVDLSAPDSKGDFSSPSCDLEAVSGSSDTSTCQPDASYTPSAVGTNKVKAGYTGDSTHDTSGSGEVDVTVAAHATETSISCPDGTVNAAESCTVSVKDVNAGSKSNPTGTVDLSAPDGKGSFASSSCSLQAVSGSPDTSSCDPAPSYTPTSAGTDKVQAGFGGDATHATSSSGEVTLDASTRTTQTSISCSDATVADGGSCTVTVKDVDTGSPSNPSGTVDLSTPDGNGSFASSACSLQAVSGSPDASRCNPPPSYTPTSAGNNKVQADFGGDATHATSSSGGTDVTVATHATETSIACPDGTVADTESCAVTVKDVNGGSKSNPTGTVELSAPDGNGSFGSSSCALQAKSGSADTSTCDPAPSYTPSSVGTNKVKADYQGDATHAASDSGQRDVKAAKHSSTTSVSCAPASVVAGGDTTCTASVSDGRSGNPPRPGGTVSLSTDGSGSFSSSGSCTLPASGANSCEVTYTPASAGSGTHLISAAYAGDSNHTASSAQTSETVTAPPSAGGGSTPAGQGVSPGALVISHRTVLVKKGKAIITVRCRGASGSVCKGSLMLVASRHTSRLRAAANSAKPVRFTIAAGHDKVLHVSLPSASLTRVRHLRKAVAIATVTLNMPGGTTKSQGRAITLVRH